MQNIISCMYYSLHTLDLVQGVPWISGLGYHTINIILGLKPNGHVPILPLWSPMESISPPAIEGIKALNLACLLPKSMRFSLGTIY